LISGDYSKLKIVDIQKLFGYYFIHFLINKNSKMFKVILQISILIILFSSCGKETKTTKDTPPPIKNNAPAAIAENLSTVKAIVVSNEVKDSINFILKVKTLSVSESSSMPSLAVVGEQYSLTPNFAVNSKDEIIKNAKNAGLKKLKNAKAKDVLKLQIFLSPGNKWMIYKNLTEDKNVKS
jgi:hypothetical protein